MRVRVCVYACVCVCGRCDLIEAASLTPPPLLPLCIAAVVSLFASFVDYMFPPLPGSAHDDTMKNQTVIMLANVVLVTCVVVLVINIWCCTCMRRRRLPVQK
jgi:hypothetical protein